MTTAVRSECNLLDACALRRSKDGRDATQFVQWISRDWLSASRMSRLVKPEARARSRITFSRRVRRSIALGNARTASAGMTTAPCASAWMTSSWLASMPKMATSHFICVICTWAWLGPIRPPTIWKPGASMSMSRNEPLVTQPATPRLACTVVCTSPQNAPKPGRSSMSWMTAIVGRPSAATYSYQSSRGGIGPLGRSLARMSPVRASPTIGGNFRSTTTIGSTVKPIARRPGATISSPLQIVGVSQAFKAPRSFAVNGCLLMVDQIPLRRVLCLDADLALLEAFGHEPASAIDPRGDEDDHAFDQRIQIRICVQHDEAVRGRLHQHGAEDT